METNTEGERQGQNRSAHAGKSRPHMPAAKPGIPNRAQKESEGKGTDSTIRGSKATRHIHDNNLQIRAQNFAACPNLLLLSLTSDSRSNLF